MAEPVCPLDPKQSQTELLRPLVKAIVHQVRTPLSSIAMGVGAVEQILPGLFEAYNLAVEHDLMEPVISSNRLELLESAFPNLQREVQKTSKFLMDLLTYIDRLSISAENMQVYEIDQVINAVVNQFPFADIKEQDLVHVDIKDNFSFRGMPVFMQDLLSNLISNSLRAIKKAGKGEIFISAESRQGHNFIMFKDSGAGMKAEAEQKVFDRFFSVRNDEIRAGLGFCRLALINLGGAINCKSVEGEYTLFTIELPKC